MGLVEEEAPSVLCFGAAVAGVLPFRVGVVPYISGVGVASFLLGVAEFTWGRGFIADQSGSGSINFGRGSGLIFVVRWSSFTWGVVSLFFWRSRAASSISGVGGSSDIPGCRNEVPRIHCFSHGR